MVIPLSRREREVAELVAEGLTNRDIAEKLVISERTAEGHVEQIRNKLGFHSRSQIAAWVASERVRPQPAIGSSSSSASAATSLPRSSRAVRLPRLSRRRASLLLVVILVTISAITLWPRPASATLDAFGGIGSFGYSGDGGPALGAQLGEITSMGFDPDGGLVFADHGVGPVSGEGPMHVRRIDRTGKIVSIAGHGEPRIFSPGEIAPNLQMIGPAARIAIGPRGEVYVASGAGSAVQEPKQAWVMRIETSGALTLIAGGLPNMGPRYTLPNVRVGLLSPRGLAIGPDGAVYVSNTGASTILAIPPQGEVRTVAGTGQRGASGDGGPATSATLFAPLALAFSADGSLHIADTSNHKVRAIDHGGIIRAIAGDGTEGFAGDGGPSTRARLSSPSDIAFASSGVLYVADSGNARVRAIARDGTITTVAGPDQGLLRPTALAVHPDGTLYIADSGTHRIYKLAR